MDTQKIAIADDEMSVIIAERDQGWNEVMELAKKYGFIVQAYGGTAMLATNTNQLETWGKDAYLLKQEQFYGGFIR